MTGHDLITALVQAPDADGAAAVAQAAPAAAVREAADLLYLEADGHGVAWLRRTVAREARQ